jgi:hypothetical protein
VVAAPAGYLSTAASRHVWAHQVTLEEFFTAPPGVTEHMGAAEEVNFSGIDCHLERLPELD